MATWYWKRQSSREIHLKHEIRAAGGRAGGHISGSAKKGKTRAVKQAEKSEIEAYLSRVPDPIKWL